MEESPSSRGGSSAISALNAFSQNNDPQRNQELDFDAQRAANATRNFVTKYYASSFSNR